jgi:type II secretory pathway component PulF
VLKVGSDFLLRYGLWLAIGSAMACTGTAAFASSLTGRRMRDRLILALPVIGTMARKQEISRVSQVISTLLFSGLDFLKAIDIATRTSKNTLLVDALKSIGGEVRSGKELGTVVAGLEFFPPVVAHVFTIGQKSGRLDSMLQRLAEDYDADVKSLSQKLSTVIEPLLIVLLAGIVGFILFATLLPILEAGNVL